MSSVVPSSSTSSSASPPPQKKKKTVLTRLGIYHRKRRRSSASSDEIKQLQDELAKRRAKESRILSRLNCIMCGLEDDELKLGQSPITVCSDNLHFMCENHFFRYAVARIIQWANTSTPLVWDWRTGPKYTIAEGRFNDLMIPCPLCKEARPLGHCTPADPDHFTLMFPDEDQSPTPIFNCCGEKILGRARKVRHSLANCNSLQLPCFIDPSTCNITWSPSDDLLHDVPLHLKRCKAWVTCADCQDQVPACSIAQGLKSVHAKAHLSFSRTDQELNRRFSLSPRTRLHGFRAQIIRGYSQRPSPLPIPPPENKEQKTCIVPPRPSSTPPPPPLLMLHSLPSPPSPTIPPSSLDLFATLALSISSASTPDAASLQMAAWMVQVAHHIAASTLSPSPSAAVPSPSADPSTAPLTPAVPR